ncbi:MAG: type II secretion system secretin GspD [Geminicoccaceae bacterium]|nr:type II secretion system secretin GspD [Geminicoccaceae bacterium]MCS7266706.1 type II secretion system secretin GspD [Geminicoccaceae bacterium]MCX7630767.1 type II secretion system secretin GspD [Geminicoccaceae bacterium]MDW8124404.1 type II secretion system secretin GspD [Geminicoccaceae bacterium]MDW8340824.1 type II secretion system secretin GspD [Geminicoccaceae bacterium]
MAGFARSCPSRGGRTAALLGLLLCAGCATPQLRSEIAETIDNLSFAPPPARTARPAATAPGAGAVGAPPVRRPEVYFARGGRGLPSGGVSAQRSSEGVEVAFDEADVKEVVRVVVGEILKKPFAIDPRVSGTVTLSTAGPVAERDLLRVLETALRMIGAGLAETDGGYLVAPLGELVGRSEFRPLGGREPPIVAPGTGATVVALRHVPANTAAQFVQPLLKRPEDVRVDAASNLILFTGTAAERQAVLDTLAILDVDWLANRAVGIFPLQYATPEALIPELEALFAEPQQPGSGLRPSVQFLPVARLNAVLAVAATSEQIAEIERWVARLDRGRTVSAQFFVYELAHASAEEAAKLVNELFGEAGPQAPAPTAVPPSLQRLGAPPSEVAQTEGGPPPTGPVVLAAQAAAPGATAAATPVKAVANKATNAVVVRATPVMWELVEATLRRLDVAPPQVLIEATIAEVLLNDALRYGVQYFIEAGAWRFGYNSTVSTPTGTTNFRNLEPLARVPGFNFIFTGGDANVTIDALSQVTEVRVLSAPSVVVRDNAEAVLTVGDQVPVTTRTAVSVENPLAPAVSSIEYRDTGVILQVKPRISETGTVALEITQEVSRVVDAGRGETGVPTPTIQQRKIKSRVELLDGQTVVLGGLIQEGEEKGRDRVPILGDIPVLGALFGSTRASNQRTELIVFITPRVMRNAEQARDISEELRARMRALRARTLGGLPPTEPPRPPALPSAPSGGSGSPSAPSHRIAGEEAGAVPTPSPTRGSAFEPLVPRPPAGVAAGEPVPLPRPRPIASDAPSPPPPRPAAGAAAIRTAAR